MAKDFCTQLFFWHTIIRLASAEPNMACIPWEKWILKNKKKGIKGILVCMMHINAVSAWEKFHPIISPTFMGNWFFELRNWEMANSKGLVHVFVLRMYVLYDMMDLVWTVVPSPPFDPFGHSWYLLPRLTFNVGRKIHWSSVKRSTALYVWLMRS